MRMNIPRHRFLKICIAVLLLFCLPGLTGCGEKEEQISSISALNGKTIAVEAGVVHAAVLKSHPELSDAEILYTSSSTDGLAMLLNRKADALAVDYVTAKVMTERYDGTMMLDETLNSAAYGFVFAKGDFRIPLFDKAIAELKNDGTIEALTQKWLLGDRESKTVLKQTWQGANGVLRCRVSADMEPICYMDHNGSPIGLDIDLLMHIAEKLDYRMEFSKSRFEDLMPSVAAGQADIAASGITVTQGRNEIVDFTDGYLDTGTVVLVRNTAAVREREGISASLQSAVRRTILDQERWRALLHGVWTSVIIIILSMALGAVFGTAVYLWYYSKSRIAHCILGIVSRVMLLLPPCIWLLAVFYLILAGNSVSNFWAAVIAFGFSFGIDVFGLLKSSIGHVDSGQIEAAVSMGYSRYEALGRIYLPQALPEALDLLEGAVNELIRCTSLVGFIAVQDFQAVADRIRAESAEPFLTILLTAIVYVFLAMAGNRLVRRLRQRICPAEKSESEIREKIMKRVGQ